MTATTQPVTDINWPSIINYIITVIVLGYGIPWLKQHAAAAKALANSAGADFQQKLLGNLESLVYTLVANIGAANLPALAKQVQEGKITNADDIKKVLYSWHDEVRQQVIEQFNHQGVDIIKLVGDKMVDSLIENAANKTAPFPGLPTADTMLVQGKADTLLQQGLNYMNPAGVVLNGDPQPWTALPLMFHRYTVDKDQVQ